jgi:hypothetical protein
VWEQEVCSKGANWRFQARHARKRTKNMKRMVVTLEVSKLRGWLNADAPCQVEREHTRRARCCGCLGRSWGDVRAQAACREGSNWRSQAGHARKRTSNILLMSVTLEVLRLSGWLNADACCQVER